MLVQCLVLALAADTDGSQPLPLPAAIVLDFDGAEIVYEPDELSDPYAGITGFSECAGTWPAYGDPQREEELLGAVAELYSDFDVVVTEELACERPHVRVVVGPFAGCGLGVGYAERRCDRNLGHGIVFAKLDPAGHRTAEQEAIVVAHEVGHAFGLGHVDNPTDVMHPSVGAGGKTFLDQCSPTDTSGSGGDSCQRIGQCPMLDPVGQNSWFGLMSMLGPADEMTPMRVCGAGQTAVAGCGCRARPDAGPLAWVVVLAFSWRRRPVAQRCFASQRSASVESSPARA